MCERTLPGVIERAHQHVRFITRHNSLAGRNKDLEGKHRAARCGAIVVLAGDLAVVTAITLGWLLG